ncbi:hypothetical protein CA13_58740 [Planctomycetes bacterium CA13]|uniref:HEAT repeat domain-containing protein n=2 Tax=Novipirellula herctigrandis TaxID=2527986 RepID=A0A5C5ZB75_9BACT|nr:hypothetical protein CA13_58740 [Planctomycetes bacterium CA13]
MRKMTPFPFSFWKVSILQVFVAFSVLCTLTDTSYAQAQVARGGRSDIQQLYKQHITEYDFLPTPILSLDVLSTGVQAAISMGDVTRATEIIRSTPEQSLKFLLTIAVTEGHLGKRRSSWLVKEVLSSQSSDSIFSDAVGLLASERSYESALFLADIIGDSSLRGEGLRRAAYCAMQNGDFESASIIVSSFAETKDADRSFHSLAIDASEKSTADYLLENIPRDWRGILRSELEFGKLVNTEPLAQWFASGTQTSNCGNDMKMLLVSKGLKCSGLQLFEETNEIVESILQLITCEDAEMEDAVPATAFFLTYLRRGNDLEDLAFGRGSFSAIPANYCKRQSNAIVAGLISCGRTLQAIAYMNRFSKSEFGELAAFSLFGTKRIPPSDFRDFIMQLNDPHRRVSLLAAGVAEYVKLVEDYGQPWESQTGK